MIYKFNTTTTDSINTAVQMKAYRRLVGLWPQQVRRGENKSERMNRGTCAEQPALRPSPHRSHRCPCSDVRHVRVAASSAAGLDKSPLC